MGTTKICGLSEIRSSERYLSSFWKTTLAEVSGGEEYCTRKPGPLLKKSTVEFCPSVELRISKVCHPFKMRSRERNTLFKVCSLSDNLAIETGSLKRSCLCEYCSLKWSSTRKDKVFKIYILIVDGYETKGTVQAIIATRNSVSYKPYVRKINPSTRLPRLRRLALRLENSPVPASS